MSSSKDYEIIQLNIKTAFLHGPIDEEIYMEQPEGFGDGPEYVWKLQKALYGLKQVAQAFYLQLRGVLKSIGFTQCETNHAVFHQCNGDKIVIILAHIDNMPLIGTPLSFLKDIKSKMGNEFDLVHLGGPKMFVRVKINRDQATGPIKISQGQYVKDILKWFEMSDCKPCDMPMAELPNLPKLDTPTIDCTLYQRGIGSLMYAMVQTHANLAYSTGLLAQHSANPGKEHWSAFK
ncbi:hypothetical protein OPQ81_011443 [Rhizoctonia solani]|nr:hypothetical protein OPQ81_011443 [Rhizoctonia solani]